MALTPLWCEGFEHGVASASGSGLFTTATGSVVTTSPRTGAYCGRVNVSAAQQGLAKTGTADFGSSPAKAFIGCAFKAATFAAGGAVPRIIRALLTTAVTAAPNIRMDGTTGKLLCRGDDTTTGQQLSSQTVNDGAWHYVLMAYDVSGTTWTVDWWVDGVAQTQVSVGGKSADTANGWGVGTGATNSTYDVYFDDLVYGGYGTTADFTSKQYEVYGYKPGADGTHNAGTTTFIDGDSATTPNFTNSTTDAYTRLDEIPWTTARRTTNNISAEVHVNGVYLEIAPETAQSGKPNALMVTSFLEYSSVSATANSGSASVVRNSAGASTTMFGDFTTGADYSESTNFYKGIKVTEPAGAWTKSEIEAIRWRIGRDSTNTDVNPRPTWQGLLLQVAYPIPVAYSLDAQPATYAVTGAVAGPISTRLIDAQPTSYAITGAAASPVAGRVVNAQPAAYTLTGTAAGVLTTRALNAQPAAYTLTGTAAAVGRTLSLDAQPGAYTILGDQPGGAGAWEVDQATLGTIVSEAGYGDQQITFTSDVDVAPGGWAVLRVGWFFTSPLDSVTDDGPGLTWDILQDNPGGGDARIALVRAFAPDGIDAGTVWTLDWTTGDVGNKTVGGSSFLGGDADSFDTVTDPANATGTAWALDYTTTEDGQLVIAAVLAPNGATDTPDAGTVELFDASVLGSGLTLLYKLADAETDTMSGVLSFSESWVAVGMQMFAGAAGSQTTLIRDALLNAQPAAYTFAGTDATLARGLFLNASAGSYVLTGADANLVYEALAAAYTLDAQPGAYTLTGAAAGLLATRLIVALPGSFLIDGAAADLLVVVPGAFTLNAESGAYAITGQPAGVLAARELVAQPGALVVTGAAASVLASRIIQTEPGVFAIVGFDGQVLAGRVLQVEPGVFAISGEAATLFGGVFAVAVRTSRTRSDVRTGITQGGDGNGATGQSVASGITQGGNGRGRTGQSVGSGRTETST